MYHPQHLRTHTSVFSFFYFVHAQLKYYHCETQNTVHIQVNKFVPKASDISLHIDAEYFITPKMERTQD